MANTFNLGNGNWAQKTEKVLAYNAENNNYKPLPFDFDRASTATRVNKQGLIETVATDEPRIDFLNNSKGHLLLEPQSTNLVTYSEDFSEWSLGANATLTFVSDIEAPDGSLGVYRLQLPATNDTFISSNSFAGQNPLALSIYAKSVNTNNDFNLYNGSASSPIKTATDKWQRFDYIGNGNQFYIVNSGDTFITDIYIWGAQAEALSYATSYIPTSGQSGGVTRSADSCSQIPPDGVIGQTEGTMLIDIDIDNNSSDFVSFFLWSGLSSNRVFIQRRGNNKFIQCQMSKSGETTVGFSGNTIIGIGRHKMAVSYSNNRLVAFIDGNKVGEENTGFSYTNQLTKIGLTENTSLKILREIKLYNTALSDSELQALTSN